MGILSSICYYQLSIVVRECFCRDCMWLSSLFTAQLTVAMKIGLILKLAAILKLEQDVASRRANNGTAATSQGPTSVSGHGNHGMHHVCGYNSFKQFNSSKKKKKKKGI